MKNSDFFKVDQILFEGGDNEVLLRGTLQEGLLSYETELLVGHSELNLLLNKYIAAYPQHDFENLFQTDLLPDGSLLHSADCSEFDLCFRLNEIQLDRPLVQIRA